MKVEVELKPIESYKSIKQLQYYYIPSITNSSYYTKVYFDLFTEIDHANTLIKRRVLYDNKEQAILHAKYLLSLSEK